MTLSAESKQIKQVPEGFICSLKAYRKLFDFVKPEYLKNYKDFDDETINNMIKVENRFNRY